MPGRSTMRALAALTLALPGVAARAQKTPPTVSATQAELMRPVHSDRMRPGDLLVFRTVGNWADNGCTVHEHTEIAGRVMSVEGAEGHGQSLRVAMGFAPVPCAGRPEKRMQPILVAIQGYTPPEQSALQRLTTANIESATIALMFQPPRPGVPTSADMLLTSSNALPVTNWSSFSGPQHAEQKTGEVTGVRGLRLELPDADRLTKLVFSRRATLQDRETLFTLAMAPVPDTESAANGGPRTPPVAAQSQSAQNGRPPRAVNASEVEICAATGCPTLAEPLNGEDQRAAWSVPLAAMGVQPRPGRRVRALGEEESVCFLGQDQILFLFARHTLMPRPEGWAPGTHPRRVRAVLLRSRDGSVIKEMEWDIRDDASPFLWSLGGSRVLVRRNGALEVLGADLAVEAHFELLGPVAFLSVAPGNGPLLLATVHEKHTPAEHEALSSFLGPDVPIEENYDLTALDVHLRVLSQRLMYALPQQPALFDGAMITTQQGGLHHWQIVRTPWGGKRAILATFLSVCPVSVKALPANSLLVEGCVPDQLQSTWYRVLDSRGATLFKGSHGSAALMQDARMDEQGDVVAVGAAYAADAVNLQLATRADAFTRQSVEVYGTGASKRAGKLLWSVSMPDAEPERRSFALSPDGCALAAFSREKLSFFRSGEACTNATAP